MTKFDNQLKKLIAQFATEHHYEFCLPPKRKKYSFRSVDKIASNSIVLDKSMALPYENLDTIYRQNPNWKIDEGASKLFIYLMKNSNPEFKSELCAHYSTFSKFKNIMGALINSKEIELAKEFFVSARQCPDKLRSPEEEETLINKIFSIYTDKKDFLKDLPIFLKNQFAHYDHVFDKRDKQFMIYHFVNNKFEGDELLKPIFNLLPEKPLDNVDDFLDIPTYKTELMRVHSKKFMSSFLIDNVANFELVSSYERILHHVMNFLNTEFKFAGLSKCFRVHNEEFDTENHKYTVLALRLEKDHTIQMSAIDKIFKDSSLYLAQHGEILQGDSLVKKALEDLNSIFLQEKLSKELTQKPHTKTRKI
jgi:hypothetical protein